MQAAQGGAIGMGPISNIALLKSNFRQGGSSDVWGPGWHGGAAPACARTHAPGSAAVADAAPPPTTHTHTHTTARLGS